MNILISILKNTKVTIILFSFYLSCFCFNYSHFSVLAQTEKYNPLENTKPDPLLPPPESDRPLTSVEKRLIREKTIILNNQAQLQLAAGNKDEAFSLWYRELRLQRALGLIEEISALGRVGAIAWQQNFPQELKIISDRLLTVQQKLTPENNLNSQLLEQLGQAYQQLRDLDRAVVIYQLIHQNNLQGRQKTLETLGELHLSRFDYNQAANTYEELLRLVQSQQNPLGSNLLQEQFYLDQLLGIYNRSSQPIKAIEIKQQLLKKYLANKKTEQLAALNISLAVDYQTLKQPKKAQKYYESAFTLAWSLQQLALAEESLQKLALLYQEYQQPTAALEIYQQLIKVDKKAHDYYNLMNTYDRIGQIYEQLNNHQKALANYKKGLELARALNYRFDDFQKKIEQLENK